MSRRFRRLYRAKPAPIIDFGFRHPETNNLTAPNNKQYAALSSGAEQIFYGGAVGGGKTVWLVVVAIMTCLCHPGVHVAIFRRHYKELQQNVVSQFFALLPPRYVKFNRQLGMATFPNGSVCWFIARLLGKDCTCGVCWMAVHPGEAFPPMPRPIPPPPKPPPPKPAAIDGRARSG